MRRDHRPRISPSILLCCALTAPAFADEPPRLDGLFPAGGRRGTSVEVRARGSFPRWPCSVRVERLDGRPEPRAQARCAEKSGELLVRLSDELEPGTLLVRLHDVLGSSTPRPFVVSDVPDLRESEPNETPAQATPVDALPAIVHGTLERNEDVDGFVVPLRRGERLVADLMAHGLLGSPMDATLQLVSPDGFVLAECDDDRGLDPRLVHVAREDGPLIVRVFAFPSQPNASIRFSGGADHVYRLTLTTGPFADHAWPPLLGPDGGPVVLWGFGLDGASRVASVPSAIPGSTQELWIPGLASTARVEIHHRQPVVESVLATPDAGVRIAPGSTAVGRITRAGEVDTWLVELAAGAPLEVEVQAAARDSLLDPRLRVLGPDGAVLASADDARGTRDASVSTRAKLAGVHRVEVGDAFRFGGPRHEYVLELGPATPGVDVSLDSELFRLEPPKPLEIPVTIARRGGFDAAVELSVRGLPEGISFEPFRQAADATNPAKLRLTTTRPSAWSGPIEIVATTDGAEIAASAPTAVPRTRRTSVWLTALPAAAPDAETPAGENAEASAAPIE